MPDSAPGRQELKSGALRALIPLEPAQSHRGSVARAVLAAHETVITELIDGLKQPRVVHFTFVRLVSVRHAGHLDVADIGEVASQAPAQIPLHDLAVIQV